MHKISLKLTTMRIVKQNIKSYKIKNKCFDENLGEMN